MLQTKRSHHNTSVLQTNAGLFEVCFRKIGSNILVPPKLSSTLIYNNFKDNPSSNNFDKHRKILVIFILKRKLKRTVQEQFVSLVDKDYESYFEPETYPNGFMGNP